MSEALVEKQKQEKEPLFSKKNRKLISNPLDSDNPITVQVLGICSALAVTIKLKPSFIMGIAVFFVMVLSSLVISLIRNSIPSRIRIIVQLGVVATLVAIVDQILQAYAYDISKQLSVFVGLIITNCIIMGRIEAFALGNKPWPSVLDAAGNALGYAAILLIVAFFRELLGSGSFFDIKVLGDWYTPNGVMTNTAGAAIILGLLIWAQRARNGYVED
ncbi:MAG: NADH:ubiquinone reductase (Na(+)-transporting) subunit D [Bacteroidetes bacterium MED-G17]|jgi:Na+-transporting NADH:ubiquinone oxidoreductase subunit D|nr:MAG: NADH:ubiquinone reductase (Na(+)-transporting) subunit D [Bacteroidetes bacterium TMED39]PDH53612.1 MAG: NADH:ubiquinone reductase (Na(+)-transporting) subunit D [Bacteroidetes bacterium MED-G17]|tara:strand:+ start:8575 stop:9225 length:651 start_codon:yes stop_codon:yes gene_type:complete